jgi:hypothetical protein
MATFQQDPLDLQTSDVKYYLGKITGAGNIGSRDQGEPLKYFNPQDIGVVQSTAILQPFDTDEFKRPATQDNTAWINFLNPANPSDTTNSTTYTVGPFSRTVTWTVGLTNRDTEVNYVTKVLSHFDDLIVGPNTFGTVFITKIRSDLALASLSLQDSILTSDDLRDSLTDIRDGDSYITESAGENTYFYKQNEDKNLFNALNSIYASSYDGGQDIIYNKGFSDFQSFYQTFEDFKDTININIAPIFDSKVGYLNLLQSLTPYENIMSGVIGNYQLTNTLDLTGISGYPAVYEDGKYLRSTTTGLEYVDITDPVLAFTGLTDTPSTITPNEYLRGTADGQNLMFSGVSFLEDVTDRPTVPQSGYLQRTSAGQLVWAAGTTSGDIAYNFTGSDFFTGLQDTPANYDQFKFLRSALNSIEYVDINEGIVSFTGLDGTPNDFSGGKYLISSSNGIEYTDIPAPVLTFTGLTDTPSSFTNASGQYLRINSAENAVEFIDISGQINSHEIAWDTYLRFGDLPPASNHAGMFTYVMIDSLSGAYVSNGTDWVKIDSDSEEGSSSFTGLSDTPNSYDSGKYLISSAIGIEYVDVVAPVVAFTGLTDTPSSYAGQSGRYLMVADAETGIEFKDPTFYTGAFVGFGGAIVFKGLDTYAPAVGWNDRKLTNLVGISGIKETYLDNEQIVLPKGKYLISAEGGVNCDSSAGANPAGKTKIGIEFTSGDYIGQTFDSFSNRGQTAGNYGQIRGSIQVAIESQNPIKFKVKSYLPTVTTPAEYSFNAAQTDVSILDLGASKDFLSFTGLLDVPNTFDGASGKYLRVSDDQTELEYVDISDTGITGAFNIGAGSGVVSGVVNQDAYFKSLVGGTNVTLSSDDSTITINSAGGGGGGGSSSYETDYFYRNISTNKISNLSGKLPDAILVNVDYDTTSSYETMVLPLKTVGSNNKIYYEMDNWAYGGRAVKIFNDDTSGTSNGGGIFANDTITQESTKFHFSTVEINKDLQEYIDAGEVLHYGGGGGGGGGGGAGGSISGFILDQFTGWIDGAGAGSSFEPVLDGSSEYKVSILNRKPAPSYTPLWFSFDIDSSDGSTSNMSYPGGTYITTGYNVGTNTLTIGAQGGTQVYNTNIYKKMSVGGGGTSGITGFTNLGGGSGLISGIADNDLQVKSLVGGTNLQITGDGESLYLNVTGVSGSSSSTTGITGATNLGAGSELASGVSGSDLYLKSLVGGTNVTLSSDDNTITINASAGGGGGSNSSGAFNSNPYVSGDSNFYTTLPDAIIAQDARSLGGATNTGMFYLAGRTDTDVFTYIKISTSNNAANFKYIFFDNDAVGTNAGSYYAWDDGGTAVGPSNQFTLSLSGVLANNQGIYFGGGGGGSSTSGITGVESLGAGSALASGISESDLMLKSLVGGTNVTLSSDDSTITIDAAGGGGAGTSSAFSSNSITSEWSNFYTDVPDALLLEDNTGNTGIFTVNQLLSSDDEIYYENRYFAAQYKFISFENTTSGEVGAYNGGVSTSVTSLSGLVASGRGMYYGGGGGSSTSTSGITNSVITRSSSFSGTLPNSVLVSGKGSSSSSFFNLSYVGTAQSYLMYSAAVSSSLNCRIDFAHNESGTITGTPANCNTPYASLQEIINSGHALYY